MLNTSNVSCIEKYLDKQQLSRKMEVVKATHKGTIKRKRNGINTSYSRKLRRKLRKNPELVKSLKRLLKCKSKSK